MIISKDLVYDLIEEKPSKEVIDIISDLGGIMGLCIGASLMSFVELVDLTLNFLFICYGCKSKRVVVEEKALESESEIRLLEVRLVKVERLLSESNKKISCLEAELSASRDQVVKY